MERHFTATGFVVQDNATLLHWHAKLQCWLPPGGHVEPNEDPVQAVLREVAEETGVDAEVVPTGGVESGLEYPREVTPPLTIMVEDINDPVQGFHQHIDFIYVCRPKSRVEAVPDGWRWVTREELAAGTTLARNDDEGAPPPDDVRLLGARALRLSGPTLPERDIACEAPE